MDSGRDVRSGDIRTFLGNARCRNNLFVSSLFRNLLYASDVIFNAAIVSCLELLKMASFQNIHEASRISYNVFLRVPWDGKI